MLTLSQFFQLTPDEAYAVADSRSRQQDRLSILSELSPEMEIGSKDHLVALIFMAHDVDANRFAWLAAKMVASSDLDIYCASFNLLNSVTQIDPKVLETVVSASVYSKVGLEDLIHKLRGICD